MIDLRKACSEMSEKPSEEKPFINAVHGDADEPGAGDAYDVEVDHQERHHPRGGTVEDGLVDPEDRVDRDLGVQGGEERHHGGRGGRVGPGQPAVQGHEQRPGCCCAYLMKSRRCLKRG